MDQDNLLPQPAEFGDSDLQSTRNMANDDAGVEAASHNYLGALTSLSRSAPLSEGSEVDLPLIVLNNVVVYPGDWIPLRLYGAQHSRLRSMLAASTPTTCRYLGILSSRGARSILHSLRRYHSGPSSYGTLVEAAAINDPDSEQAAMNQTVLKARGRHRFRIVGASATYRDGILWARCLILPEHSFPRYTDVLPIPRMLKLLPRYPHEHQSTYWPLRTARLASPYDLMAKAKQLLKSVEAWEGLSYPETTRSEGQQACAGGDNHHEGEAREGEKDPIRFAFALAANLPLDDAARQRLLMLNNVVDRLREEIKILKDSADRALCCCRCRYDIASKNAIFSVSGAEGVVGSYLNPNGYVHQTVTLRKLLTERAIYLYGEAETDNSWFPGYAWTIAYCARCAGHLGWLFTRVESARGRCTSPRTSSTGSEARPAAFWGLRRGALVDGAAPAEGVEDTMEEVEDGTVDDEASDDQELTIAELQEVDGLGLNLREPGTDSEAAER